ncbi:RagB/SusD family nutrient uptake outer membrane protein [Gaetbulibacter saemankumensis]|uniref:RagB/SusD family nutrient uptake outer membrane protein n=1 Tax=Gaetbulibacter saemankumensis TaxID=311208 RepID=UPI000480CA51|nr:RagB/SusD family nutrient uptake outer membrane protein [Gaetbulibacter saemankumensis]
MKNLKYYMHIGVYSLIVMFSFLACHDKLDLREGQLNTGDYDFTQTENMIQPLVGAYQQFYTRGWEELLLLKVRGDDVNAGGLGDQQPFADTDMFIYDDNYWMYNALWNGHYQDIIGVNNAASLIENFKEFATGSDVAKADQYIAETKVLRGWFHLNLSRTFGDIFIINTTIPDDDIANGVATKDGVMQYISDLMDEAIPMLPNVRPNERIDVEGGVTRYTALAIKAMANLELKNYQGVADATGAIIASGKFGLYPDFYQAFKKPGELSNENLLEMQYSDYGNSTGDTFYHLYAPFGSQNWTPARENAESGWGFFEPSMKFIKFMLDRGETIRLETSVLFTDRGIAELQEDSNYSNLPAFVNNTTRDGDRINDYSRALFASGKHYLPSIQLTESRNEYGAGKNNICIRYAEILLMHAEALTRGANSSAMTADQAVNEVRQRAGLLPISGVTADQVMDEKFAEFAMEWGIRYWDMIRLQKYDELSYDGRTFTADKALLPYPQAQQDALPLPSGNDE